MYTEKYVLKFAKELKFFDFSSKFCSKKLKILLPKFFRHPKIY